MNIDKSVILTLDDREIYLLRSLARMCANDLNERFKSQTKLWDLSFSEMHELDTFAVSLESL